MQNRIVLQNGESLDDAIHGCLPIALKRASLMGRAPVIHDLVVAFTIWGFLDDTPPRTWCDTRKRLFAEVAHAGHHVERERLLATVPVTTLWMSPDEIDAARGADWKSLLDLDGPLHAPR